MARKVMMHNFKLCRIKSSLTVNTLIIKNNKKCTEAFNKLANQLDNGFVGNW